MAEITWNTIHSFFEKKGWTVHETELTKTDNKHCFMLNRKTEEGYSLELNVYCDPDKPETIAEAYKAAVENFDSDWEAEKEVKVLATEHADTFTSINDLYEEYKNEKDKLFEEVNKLSDYIKEITMEKSNNIVIENIEFNGKQYPVRECTFTTKGESFTGRNKTISLRIASEELNKVLINENGYTSKNAEDIDSSIAYFVPEKELRTLDENQMLDYIYENIDAEIYQDFIDADEKKQEQKHKEHIESAVKVICDADNIRNEEIVGEGIEDGSDSVYFSKDDEGKVFRTTLIKDSEPYFPRDPEMLENLGTLVMQRDTVAGDTEANVDNIYDYMIEQLELEYESSVSRSFRIPDVEVFIEKAKENPALEKYIKRRDGNIEPVTRIDTVALISDIESAIDKSFDLSELPESEKIDFSCNAPQVDATGRFINHDLQIIFKYDGVIENGGELNLKLDELCDKFYEIATKDFGCIPSTFNYNSLDVSNKNENLTRQELFEKFKNTKAAALPVSYGEHGPGARWLNISGDAKYLSGIIFVDKDNKEYLDMIKGEARDSDGNIYSKWKSCTEKEASEWAEKVLEGEIELYNQYLQGECYGVRNELYDPETRCWKEVETVWGCYPISDLDFMQGRADIMIDNDIGGELITKEAALEICKDSPEKVIEMFFDKAKKHLPEYENNPLMAYKTQLLLWQNNGNSDRAEIVADFVKQNCHSPKELNFFLIDKMDYPVTTENIHSIAEKCLPVEDLNNHATDLYIASSPAADRLIEMLDKSTNGIKSGMITTFTDQITGRKSYDLPFCATHNITHEPKELTWEDISKNAKNGTLKTTKPLMSSTEIKVHRMLDSWHNERKHSPVDTAKDVLQARPDAAPGQYSGDNWWKKATQHLMESGGIYTDEDPKDTIKRLEKYGLIKNDFEQPELYGPCYDSYCAYMKVKGTPGDTRNFTDFVEEVFPNKNDMIEYLQGDPVYLEEYRKMDRKKEDLLLDKYFDKASGLFSKYMHMYLKDLNVFDNDARDRQEKKDIDWQNNVNKKSSKENISEGLGR